MLNLIVEQCIKLKFLVKLQKTPTECFEMLSIVYVNDCLPRAWVFEWHKRVTEGHENAEDEHPDKWPRQIFFVISPPPYIKGIILAEWVPKDNN